MTKSWLGPATSQAARGYSLIEVLVTLLVVSVGLLSMVSLQISTLKYHRNTLFQHEAMMLAHEMIESLHLKHRGVGSDGHESKQLHIRSLDLGTSGDEYERWTTALSEKLPNGRGFVSVVDQEVRIVIEWSEGSDSSGEPRKTSMTFISLL